MTSNVIPFPISLAMLLLLSLGARATPFTPLSVEQLARKSQIVIHGTVASRTVQRDPEGRIYTRVELQITEIWKGSVQGDRLALVHGGGVLGEEATVISGQESYEMGEEVVAFLVRNQRGEAVTLGLAQGKFLVWSDAASGRKFAHNPFHGRAPESKPDAPRQRAPKSSLELSELKGLVKGEHP